jgi:hypothetical protein
VAPPMRQRYAAGPCVSRDRDVHVRAQRSQPADLHRQGNLLGRRENSTTNTVTATFTGHINALGSDGSRITDHFVAHVTVHSDGTVTVETDRLSCP